MLNFNRKFKKLVYMLLTALLALNSSFALNSESQIRAMGRKEITVTTSSVRFGDLAELSSNSLNDDEAVIGLQKIFIERSPEPGKSVTISAAKVLERLKDEGVDLKVLGYALPRIMTVHRASRAITLPEVEAVVTEALNRGGQERTLKQLNYKEQVHVAPGDMLMEVEDFSASEIGRVSFAIIARVKNQQPVRFNVDAVVDEWVEVPVARRSLRQGEVVGRGDVMMARLSAVSVPSDAAQAVGGVLGLETKHQINYGEVFRQNQLIQPPVIESGNQVTMVYRSGALEATASGIALGSAAIGESIKVRNEGSKRIVTGTVLSPGLVGVKP